MIIIIIIIIISAYASRQHEKAALSRDYKALSNVIDIYTIGACWEQRITWTFLKAYYREEAAAAFDGLCWLVFVVILKLWSNSSDSGWI